MNVFDLVAKLSLDKKEYTEGISEAREEGESFGSKVSKGLGTAMKIGASAVTATTTAMIAFGKTAVDSGKDFDVAMSQVGATMGFTMDELSDSTSEASKTMTTLRDFAQQMGSSTAFSATEASEALNYMALAGYNAETSMHMLPTVLNLASAGGIELASASDMVTDAQSALGLSLEETSTMVDQMATASSKSNTSVAQLGEAFLTIGANAKSLSGGTQELSTALGLLADNGIKGAEGGTHLRNILMALNPTTDKAVMAWEELGISAYDADGNLRPLEDTFGDLSDAMADMTDQERTDMLSSMFNKTDLASVNALLATSTDRWEELSNAIGDSEGSAQAMAEVQLDNLQGDITLFQSALEGAQIAVSDKLTPSLRKFVSFGSDGLSRLTEAFTENGFDGAMDEFGSILSDGLAMVTEMLPEMIEGGAKIVTSLIEGISENSEMIFESATEVLMLIVNTIIENLPTIIQMACELIVALANGIAQALPTLIPTIVDVVLTIVDNLIDNIDMLIDCAIELIIALADGIIKALPILIEKAPTIIVKLVGALIDALPKLLTACVKLISTLWEGIKNNLPTLLSKIPQIITGIKDKLIEGVSKIKDVGKNLIEGLWDGINDKIQWLKDKISGFGDEILGKIKDIFGVHSPSKVFAEIGGYLAEGLGVGWDDKIEDVTDDIESSLNLNYASKASIGSTSKSASAVPIIINSTLTLEPSAQGIFKLVKQQNDINTRATGYNQLAMARG